jgi:hypothetical protein
MGTTRVNNLDSCDCSLGWVPPGGILEANSFLSISYEMGCVVKSSFRRGYSQNLLNKGVRAHFASIGTYFRRNWTGARNAMPAACAYARSVEVQVTSHYEPGPGNFMQRQGLARCDRMNAFEVLSLIRFVCGPTELRPHRRRPVDGAPGKSGPCYGATGRGSWFPTHRKSAMDGAPGILVILVWVILDALRDERAHLAGWPEEMNQSLR